MCVVSKSKAAIQTQRLTLSSTAEAKVEVATRRATRTVEVNFIMVDKKRLA